MGMNFITPTAKWRSRIVDPADLAPYAWYDASVSGSVIEVSGRVSNWLDMSGNGKHLSQSNASIRPTTGTTQNGRAVIGFAQSSAAIPLFLSASPASDWRFLHDGTENVILAAAAQPITGNSNASVIFGNQSSSTSTFGASFSFNQSTSVTSRVYHPIVNSVGGAITGSGDNVSTNGPTVGLWQSASVFHDVTNRNYYRFYIHPRNFFQPVSMTNVPFTPSDASSLRVGTLSTTTGHTSKWVGYIGEIVIVRGVNATPESAFALREYLRQKWATL